MNQAPPLNLGITKIAYKLLNLLEFKCSDAIGKQKLVDQCIETLIYLYDTTSSLPSTPEPKDFLNQVVLLMRICSNLSALEDSYGDYIIENWFRVPSRSLRDFFNYFFEKFAVSNLSFNEIYWFIGNITKGQLSETTQNYLAIDDFFFKIKL